MEPELTARRLAARILPLVALGACGPHAPDPGPDRLGRLALAAGSTAAVGHVVHFEWHGPWSADLTLTLDGEPLPTAQSGQGPVVLRALIPHGSRGPRVFGLADRDAALEIPVEPRRGDPGILEVHPGSAEATCANPWLRLCAPLASEGTCEVPHRDNQADLDDRMAYASNRRLQPDLDVQDVTRDPDFPQECCLVVFHDNRFDGGGTGGSGEVAGRPFTVERAPRTATLRPGTDWATAPFADHGLTPDQRAHAAATWTRIALAEHASVASFARFQLELLGLGAPADLLVRAAKAQADEAEHARFAFALAAHLGATTSPGPLSLDHALARAQDVEAILVGAILEGCVEETVAAAEMRVAATGAHVDLRARLAQIAEDETRHAELSWAFVRWLLEERPELAPLARETFARAGLGPRPEARDNQALATVGLLDPAQRWSVRRSVFQEVLVPAMEALFAR